MENNNIFNNPKYSKSILNTLSEAGVYVLNLKSGKFSFSNLWKPVYGNFQVNNYLEFIHEEDRARVKKAFDDIAQGVCSGFEETYRLIIGTESCKWIRCKGYIVNDIETGAPLMVIGVDTDITDIKDMEFRLKESIKNERHKSHELEILRQVAAAISSSLDIKETVNIILKEVQRVIPYDAASVQILQNSTLQIIGGAGFENYEEIIKLRFKYPEEGSLSTKAIDEKIPVLSNNVTADFPSFHQPDEERIVYSWIGIPLIRKNEVIGLIAVDSFRKNAFTIHHRELAETIGIHIAIALENALLHGETFQLAMEDSLTKLGSRHYLQKESRNIFEKAVRDNEILSLAMLDIDHFKKVNDEFGHDTGDIILKNIAGIISSQIRKTDLLVRFGGEEFILVMSGTDARACKFLMERIRKSVAAYHHKEINRPVTISLGYCAGIPDSNKGFTMFQKKADEALYVSKKEGRNRVTAFSFPDN